MKPKIVLRTRNPDTFLAGIMFVSQSHAFGKRGDRWVSGTLLPDGSYVDDYVTPTPLENLRERWRRKRREYVIGVDAELPPEVAEAITVKRGGVPVVTAAGDLLDHLGVVGGSVLFNFDDISYHSSGLEWPPEPS
jgi:hypothetical protein